MSTAIRKRTTRRDKVVESTKYATPRKSDSPHMQQAGQRLRIVDEWAIRSGYDSAAIKRACNELDDLTQSARKAGDAKEIGRIACEFAKRFMSESIRLENALADVPLLIVSAQIKWMMQTAVRRAADHISQGEITIGLRALRSDFGEIVETMCDEQRPTDATPICNSGLDDALQGKLSWRGIATLGQLRGKTAEQLAEMLQLGNVEIGAILQRLEDVGMGTKTQRGEE